ncbi:hypothetical protein V6N11_020320 [Hibiscus sabdariffa]|uniref:Uncharacterized protein n=1 Tax=Hibiscus sabdariffa TaxID=183260 RepID=A0ABR2Q829_9ROSI
MHPQARFAVKKVKGSRVMPESDPENVFESKSLKNILQVKHFIAGNGVGEHRNQSTVKLSINDGLPVGIEDTVAEKTKESGNEGRAFGVVIEVGIENMEDIVGVGS